MNNKPSRLLLCTACAVASFVIAIVSCNKKFDAPPVYIPPNITTNTTIAALKALHKSGQVDTLSEVNPATDSMIIQGTVTANDSSGNFYKQIILQDSTGAIAVSIDDYNLYATFPIGRQVYVKLKGLFMAENTGLIYIGGSPDNGGAVAGIASRLKDQYVVKGEVNHPVTPTVVSITDLKNNPSKYMYTLVQFQNFEVKTTDTSKTYAFSTPTSKTDANIIVKGCSSTDTMIIRTSGYSYFANVFVPKGNGTLTAIYAYYKSPYNSKITPQVIIRDTSDVQFTGSRCDGTTPPPTSDATLLSIKDLRALYTGSDVTLGAYKIGGIVISDAANGNVSGGNVIMQNGDYGISVFFGTTTTITYKPGDSVVIDVTGKTLKQYNGSLEVDNFGATPPGAVSSNNVVTPREVTVTQFNASLSTMEYTLVKIKSATASPSDSTYKGNRTLKDATGTTTLYTAYGASFASVKLPAGAQDWVGYGSFYKTTQELQIRNTTDVSGATGDTSGTTIPPSSGDGIALTTSPYSIDFNTIGSGLPTGVFIKTGATSTVLGTDGTLNMSNVLWKTTSNGFKNFASATGLSEGTDSATQVAAANRALGIRQTSSLGDPGGAFVFELNNTTGKSSLAMNFQLQSLDSSSPRTTTWIVDYGIGDNPTTFTQASTGTLTTGNKTFSNNVVSVNFGSALDNQSGKVWIRVVTVTSSTGSGNRASSAIDDVKFSFN